MPGRHQLVLILVLLLGLGAVGFGTACRFFGPQQTPALIPLPQTMQLRHGSFKLLPQTGIRVDAAARDTGEFLAARLRQATGYPFKVEVSGQLATDPGNIVLLSAGSKTNLGDEGYELNITGDAAILQAPTAAGLFYGAQTLLQLLPPQIFSPGPVSNAAWSLPCARIQDRPRFAWRGFMLDTSRHFFARQEIESLLDAMALHKLNRFHWHLTDDQGWRLQIKAYPKLTDVGAWRDSIGFGLDPKASTTYGPDGRYGGFYSRQDVREIVAYAQARHIVVVPEIEMPGHSSAALAAYPEYSCFGGPYSVEDSAGVFNGVYCAGKEETFLFLQNVLLDVMEQFPGPYIHVGGDEAPKQNWRKCPLDQARMKTEGLKNEKELQSYFIRRIGRFVESHDRTLIGWSEIQEGGLPPKAVLMDWIGGGKEAAAAGHDAVMSPVGYCYFDYYQSTNHAAEPRAPGGFLPLEKIYAFEPMPEGLDTAAREHLLGGQANLWTEYIPSLKQAQYMTFPRLCALSETVWSPRDTRDWKGFQARLKTHCQRLQLLGIDYRGSTP
jgi:hexosaminidase